MISVQVRLFAGARQAAGDESVCVELPSGATVADLRKRLVAVVPALRPLLAHATFAVNASYVGDTAPLSDGVEVACIPPVSGG